MADDGNYSDKDRPANNNHLPDGRNAGVETDSASERLDAIVLSIARLIGRQMAREHFDALRAANDNRNKRSADDDG